MHNQKLFSNWPSHPDLADRDTYRALLKAILIAVVALSIARTLLFVITDQVSGTSVDGILGTLRNIPYLIVEYGLGLLAVALLMRNTVHWKNHGLRIVLAFLLIVPVEIFKQVLYHWLFMARYYLSGDEFQNSVDVTLTVSYYSVFNALESYVLILGFFALSLSPFAQSKRRWYFIVAFFLLWIVRSISALISFGSELWLQSAIFDLINHVSKISVPLIVLWLLLRNQQAKWVPSIPIVKTPPQFTAWLFTVATFVMWNYDVLHEMSSRLWRNSWLLWVIPFVPFVIALILFYRNNLTLLFILGLLYRILALLYIGLGVYSFFQEKGQPILFLYGVVMLVIGYFISKERTSWDIWRIQQRTLARKEAENL